MSTATVACAAACRRHARGMWVGRVHRRRRGSSACSRHAGIGRTVSERVQRHAGGMQVGWVQRHAVVMQPACLLPAKGVQLHAVGLYRHAGRGCSGVQSAYVGMQAACK